MKIKIIKIKKMKWIFFNNIFYIGNNNQEIKNLEKKKDEKKLYLI